MKRYNVSICLLIKDEGRYLPEWLEWHIGIGVEHFYIYDNGSTISVMEDIPEPYREMVTVIDFPPPRSSTQKEAYFDCLKRFREESEWIAFLDTDEFLRVVDGRSIRELMLEYPIEDAVLIPWVIYNANGQIEDDGRPVRERFTQVATELFPQDEPMHKAIVRTRRVTHMGAHSPIPTLCSLSIVDENHESVKWIMRLSGEKIVVDHYFTRSYAEWLKKMERGSCDPYYSRKHRLFFQLNPDIGEIIKNAKR